MTLKSRISRQIKNMPKYKINKEVSDTQDLAYARAFGRPQEILSAEQSMKEGASQTLNEAKDISSSTSSLLATLAAVESGKQASFRGLAGDEASIRTQNMQDVYKANQMAIDEKDKAWYQNVYAPWEAKLRGLQQQKANRNAFWSSVAGGLASSLGTVASAFINPAAAAGSLGAGAAEASGAASQVGNASATLYGYNPNMPYS